MTNAPLSGGRHTRKELLTCPVTEVSTATFHTIPNRPKPPVAPASPAPPAPTLEPWQMNVEWSMSDEGPSEREVQKEWARLDRVYPHTNLMLQCVFNPAGGGLNPFGRGRKTAMGIAIDAAKHGFDQKAFDITLSTQIHNGEAELTIVQAGVWTIAEYLRTK